MNRSLRFCAILFGVAANVAAYAGGNQSQQEIGFYGPNGAANGAYLGVEMGYHSTNTNLNILSVNQSADINNSGVIGGLYLGYGMNFGWFDLAIEVFGHLESEDDLSQIVNNQTVTIAAINNSYGGGILPGIELGRGELYARMDLLSSRFKFHANATNNGGSNVETNLRKRMLGFDLGGGFAYKIADHFSARVEYIHTWYGTEDQVFDGLGVTDRVKPTDNKVLAGIAYHFFV